MRDVVRRIGGRNSHPELHRVHVNDLPLPVACACRKGVATLAIAGSDFAMFAFTSSSHALIDDRSDCARVASDPSASS